MNSSRRWFAALAVAPIVFTAGLAQADGGHRSHRPFCDPLSTAPGHKRCFSHVITNPDGSVHVSTTPQGYGPSDLTAAYGIPATGPGDGKIVAVIDAYDAPDIEQDLATYRSQFGLPACTTANGCFQKLNQNGVAGSYPTANTSWGGEISLDVEMVSAICPSCKIMLVEADDAGSDDDLYIALQTAISKGAAAVSNSYGGGEDDDSSVDTQYFAGHTGILITVSAGDDGYGAQYPATSPNVLAIGGTSLVKSTSAARGWTETVWGTAGNSTNGGTGSGCSAEFARPSWQSALPSGCAHRMEADVSASADPEYSVATYCGATDCGSSESGWVEVGGTSEASPIVASMFTLLGLSTQPNSWVYSNTTDFYDVTTGTNAISKKCSTANAYFCNAEVGYDGPTGWGTPDAPKLLQGGTTPPPVTGTDAGTGTGSDDAGTGTGTGTGGEDAGTGTGTGTGTGSGTGEDAGFQGGGNFGDDAGPGTGEDSGLVSPDDGGATTGTSSGGNNFGGSGSGASSGCSCNAPGTSSPLGEGGASLLALGAVVLLGTRRRRS